MSYSFVQLEGEVRPCALVDVELGDEVDLHPANLARAVGHAVHELAEAPAEVLEAQEDGRADEVPAGRVEGVERVGGWALAQRG